ncbi:MAG: hypothetical protein EOM72_09240 [Opitutae bacterium]|nr:hypothetical protein [Opitutae bacterium]
MKVKQSLWPLLMCWPLWMGVHPAPAEPLRLALREPREAVAEADVYSAGHRLRAERMVPGSPALLALAPPAAEMPGSSSAMRVQADNSMVSAGVGREFSAWSDFTAVLRPSRWRLPIRVGEPLSFLNWRAWKEAPGRTAKILGGVVVVAGLTYAAVEMASSSGDESRSPQGDPFPPPAPASAPVTGGGRPNPDSSSDSKPIPSSDGGGGGGGSPGGESSGGDESPF